MPSLVVIGILASTSAVHSHLTNWADSTEMEQSAVQGAVAFQTLHPEQLLQQKHMQL